MTDRKPDRKGSADAAGEKRRSSATTKTTKTAADNAKDSVKRNAQRRLDELEEARKKELEDAHSIKNTYGEDVCCLLNSVTHVDDLLQGADYVGHEPVYCDFTQRPCVRLVDQNGDVVPIDDARLTTLWSEIIKFCSIEIPAGKSVKLVPAKFKYDDLKRIADTLRNETKYRLPHRRVNRAKDLFDGFCDVGDESDGEFVANWFLWEWGAISQTPEERELVRQLSIRMGVNILDRAYRPGGGLKMWPVLVGPPNLGKTLFVRAMLPLSMQDGKLHGQALALSKTRDEIVRKIAGVLVCELPELADVQVKETERLKDILSMSVETAHVLYKSWEQEFNMTCAFVGTANPDRPLLPPSDPALALRLPIIEIGNSPWGSERRVDEQLNENSEELKRRLWRGWKYWYHVAKVDPEMPLSADLQKLVLERAKRFTYIDTGTSEALEAVTAILNRAYMDTLPPDNSTPEGAAAVALLKDGVMAVELVRVLDRVGFKMAGVRNPTVKLGRLMQLDDDWVAIGGNAKGLRWTCRSICERHADRVDPDGAVRASAADHGMDLTAKAPPPRSSDEIDF